MISRYINFAHDFTKVIIKCKSSIPLPKRLFHLQKSLQKCCPVSLLTHLLLSAKLLGNSVHTPSVSDGLMCHNKNIHNWDKGINTLIMSLLLVRQIEPVQADRQVTVSSSPAWLCFSHETCYRNCSLPPGKSPCPTESVFRKWSV